MSRIIIGIHGLANKPPSDVLEDWWKKSIREGLKKNESVEPDFDFRLVYWADLLYRARMHRDAGFEFDKLYNDEPYLTARKTDLKTHNDGMLDELRRVGGNVSGWLTDRVHDVPGFDSFSGWVIAKTARDLDFYYDDNRRISDRNGQMRVARRVLMDELQDVLLPLKGHTLMVVAHSMGSIIAYDVLRDIGRNDADFRVATFVTIGAPLGLGTVKANVISERTYDVEASKRLRTPTVVNKWVNYADRKDPVSADAHLSDDYGPNKRNVKVEDDLVCNDYGLKRNAKGEPPRRNHHKSYGYLRTPELSARMRRFLRA